jgi:hypothetical protein
MRIKALGRTLTELDAELAQLASGVAWEGRAVERVTLAMADAALASLAHNVTLPSVPVAVVEAPVEAPVEAIAADVAASVAPVEAVTPDVAASVAPVEAVAPDVAASVAPVEAVAPDVAASVAPVEAVAPSDVVSAPVVAAPELIDDLPNLVDEPEVDATPASTPDAPENEALMSFESDDVLMERAPSSHPPALEAKPGDGGDLGELMFEMEPELTVGSPPPPSASVPRLTLSTGVPVPRAPTAPPRAPVRAPSRAIEQHENLELDLSDLINEVKPPSVKPPPLLRAPPPTPPQRPPPPPVPRATKPVVTEIDLIEFDDSEIES